MILEQVHINRLIRNLKQISFESRSLLKDFNKDKYAAFSTLYSETFNFIQQIEIKNAEIENKIRDFPTISQLDSLVASTISSSLWIIAFAQPYIAIMIFIVTAPISIPLLIVKYLRTEKLKQKIRQIESVTSSLAFMLENPRYFIKTDNNKIDTEY